MMRFKTAAVRSLGLLIAGGVFSGLSAGLVAPVLSIFAYERGLDLERLGLTFAIAALLPALLQPLCGAISDRRGRRAVLTPLALLSVLMLGAVAIARSPFILAFGLCVRATFDQCAAPIFAAAAADLLPENRRASFLSWFSSASSLAFVIALFASPLIGRVFSTRQIILLAAAIQLGDALLLLGLPAALGRSDAGPVMKASGTLVQMARALLAPIADLRCDRSRIALFGFLFLRAFSLSVFPIYLPLWLVNLGEAPTSIGPTLALSWIVFALVQPLGGRLSERLRPRKLLITIGLVGMVAGTLFIAAAAYLPAPKRLLFAVAAWVFLALPDGLCRSAVSALPLDLAPKSERGRFIGGLGTVTTLSGVLAPLFYGVIAHRAGLPLAFLLSGGVLLAAVVVLARVRDGVGA